MIDSDLPPLEGQAGGDDRNISAPSNKIIPQGPIIEVQASRNTPDYKPIFCTVSLLREKLLSGEVKISDRVRIVSDGKRALHDDEKKWQRIDHKGFRTRFVQINELFGFAGAHVLNRGIIGFGCGSGIALVVFIPIGIYLQTRGNFRNLRELYDMKILVFSAIAATSGIGAFIGALSGLYHAVKKQKNSPRLPLNIQGKQ